MSAAKRPLPSSARSAAGDKRVKTEVVAEDDTADLFVDDDTDTAVKSESSAADLDTTGLDFNEIAILKWCLHHSGGTPYKQAHSVTKVQQAIVPMIVSTKQLFLEAMNQLTSKNRLSLLHSPDNTLQIRMVDLAEVNKLNGLSQIERQVYQYIGNEGTSGLWSRELKMRTKLPPVQLNKALKLLMSRKLIKLENSIEGKNRKVYMLFELQPHRTIAGSSWYSNGEYDEQYVATIEKLIVQNLAQQVPSAMTADQILQAIENTGVFSTVPELEDMVQLCESLCLDGMIQHATMQRHTQSHAGSKQTLYTIAQGGQLISPFSMIPCSICPVADKCIPGGIINPISCQYYTKWLSF